MNKKNKTNMGIYFLSTLSLLLIVSLTSAYLTINHLDNKLTQARMVIGEKEDVIRTQRDTISMLERNIKEKEMDIKEINEKMDLLVTFKDAGFDDRSVSDIRELLDIADHVPYGSPFKSGHYFTSFYGKRDELNFGGSPNGHHAGVDIKPRKRGDTIVRATADGVITDFGVSETLGKYVVFETEGGYKLKYGHLNTIFWQDVDKRKVKDIPVKKGDRIGVMGNTGTWSTGPHLHFEIHYYNQEKEQYIELNPRRIIEYIGGKRKEDKV